MELAFTDEGIVLVNVLFVIFTVQVITVIDIIGLCLINVSVVGAGVVVGVMVLPVVGTAVDAELLLVGRTEIGAGVVTVSTVVIAGLVCIISKVVGVEVMVSLFVGEGNMAV